MYISYEVTTPISLCIVHRYYNIIDYIPNGVFDIPVTIL